MERKLDYYPHNTSQEVRRVVFADIEHPLTKSIQGKYDVIHFKEMFSLEMDEFFFLQVVVVIETKSLLQTEKEFWQKHIKTFSENVRIILLESSNYEDQVDEEFFKHSFFHIRLPSSCSPQALGDAVRTAFAMLAMNSEILELDFQHAYIFQDFQRLVDIGKALLNTRNFDELLSLIVQETTNLIACDGVSIYVVERNANSDPIIRFKKSLIALNFNEFILPIDSNSIVGHVVKTKKPLLIDDAYNIPPNAPYAIDKQFDEISNYRTRSMLVIPMQNHANEVVGAIQLINRKKNAKTKLTLEQMQKGEGILTFDDKSVELASAMAGQAAVAIENNRLVNEIHQLFEGFVKASVKAIEQRDPSTRGHSERVAALTVLLAQEVSHDNKKFASYYFSDAQIREIRYAALLHDFGKVGVREKVLTKAKKLYPEELEFIRMRFRYIRKILENESQKKLIDFFKKNKPENFSAFEMQCQIQLTEQLEELDKLEDSILKTNEPSYYKKDVKELLPSLLENKIFDGHSQIHYLNQHEFLSLSTAKGSLTAEERKEIENHVSHTYEFLKQISWTSDLQNVPNIAHGHHEKLDGSGYPLGLRENEISLQSKIMAIADIFDALSSADRYYKKGISLEKTLEILNEEASLNHLDKNLLELFVSKKVYERALKAFS